MIHQPGYVKALLKKYIDGSATASDTNRLMAAWDIYDDEELSEMIAELTKGFKKRDINKPGLTSTLHGLNLSAWRWPGIGICILVIVIFYFLAKHTNKPAQQEIYCGETNQAEGLPASRFGCTITLADKRKIILDSSSSTGEIARQGSIVILQPERGVIAYKGTDTISPGDTTSLYNIIQTTAGQQYQIKLMDGSTVRLNASSAIKIPVRFKKSLSLLLTGEALFDIVPDSGKLFYVRTQHAELFMADANVNVKSYPGSNTVATVISGKIIIKSNTDSAKLSEGEQAIVYTLNNRKDYTLSVRKARTADVVSWKSQIRVYSDAYMREFVSDMGRWYHLKIVSLACVPANARISISICYNASLETVFQIFRDKGLVFKREGNNIRFCAPPVKVGRS